jgi:hypothetical protein
MTWKFLIVGVLCVWEVAALVMYDLISTEGISYPGQGLLVKFLLLPAYLTNVAVRAWQRSIRRVFQAQIRPRTSKTKS